MLLVSVLMMLKNLNKQTMVPNVANMIRLRPAWSPRDLRMFFFSSSDLSQSRSPVSPLLMFSTTRVAVVGDRAQVASLLKPGGSEEK